MLLIVGNVFSITLLILTKEEKNGICIKSTLLLIILVIIARLRNYFDRATAQKLINNQE